MAEAKSKHRRCVKCNTLIWRCPGQYKILTDAVEAQSIAVILNKSVNIDDVLCNRCRKIAYTKQNFNVANESHDDRPADSMDPQSSKPIESQSSEPMDSQSSEPMDSQSSEPYCTSSQTSNSSTVDPSFVAPEADHIEPTIEMAFPRVVSTHKYCFLCGSLSKLVVVPFAARHQVFAKSRIFIPNGNRCCSSHLIRNRFFEDELANMRIFSNSSILAIEELHQFLNHFSVESDRSISDKVGDFTLSEERLKVFTGLDWESLIQLREMMTSMRNTQNREITQAIVVFLFKLRTGNSNAVTASVLGLQYEQEVSQFNDAVVKSFEKDILPFYFGFGAIDRQNLIDHETSDVARQLYDVNDQLVLIFDGTYVRHEKSKNNEFQRRSYSGQKKTHLCKPFTIVTTNGYIVESLGPFSANQNDAQILRQILQDPNGLEKLMKEGDICVVDRGFRDVIDYLTEQGYKCLMPALKGKRKQLTTKESNDSRRVTKIRWVVEAVHGIVGKKYRLLHNQVDNKLLPKISSYNKIACFLHNQFGKRLNIKASNSDLIVSRIKSADDSENTLAKEIEEKHWIRRKIPFTKINPTGIIDFPEMTMNDLEVLFTGSYQLRQSVSYLAELMDDDNNFDVGYAKECPNLIKVEVKSRHINRQCYKCFIEYTPNSLGYGGIRRYCCECANGNRTIGCCSHVAAVIYYLSHGRYLSRILRPAEILSKLFIQDEIVPVINEDSDED